MRIDTADKVVFHFHEKHVALTVEADFIGFVQPGGGGRATIPGIACLSIAGHGRHFPGFQIQSQDAVVLNLGDEKSSPGSQFHAKRLPHVDRPGRALAAVIILSKKNIY